MYTNAHKHARFFFVCVIVQCLSTDDYWEIASEFVVCIVLLVGDFFLQLCELGALHTYAKIKISYANICVVKIFMVSFVSFHAYKIMFGVRLWSSPFSHHNMNAYTYANAVVKTTAIERPYGVHGASVIAS